MATAEMLLTAEEFAALPDPGPCELRRGRIVPVNPPFPFHGFVCAQVAWLLGSHIRAGQLGWLLTNDSGVVTERDPDTVRGADLAFYRRGSVRFEELQQRGYPSVPPELVVEVMSPYDRLSEVVDKVGEYLRAGVQTVVVLDCRDRSVHVYREDAPIRHFAETDTFALPDRFPGFEVPVREFFNG